jgi:RimJ/RimL family protein N-acetyltransferase
MTIEQRLHAEQETPAPMEIVSSDGEITLQQFTPEDAKEVFDLIDRNREHLSQFGEDTPQKYPTYESVLESIVHPKNPKRLRFGIRNKTGEYMGSINLTSQGFHQGEVGYYVGEEFTGKGYTTKAVQTLTDYAFVNLGYEVLFGVVAEGNTASMKVLKKAGYVQARSYTDVQGKNVVDFIKAHDPADN